MIHNGKSDSGLVIYMAYRLPSGHGREEGRLARDHVLFDPFRIDAGNTRQKDMIHKQERHGRPLRTDEHPRYKNRPIRRPATEKVNWENSTHKDFEIVPNDPETDRATIKTDTRVTLEGPKLHPFLVLNGPTMPTESQLADDRPVAT
jgi:hypothetical protein